MNLLKMTRGRGHNVVKVFSTNLFFCLTNGKIWDKCTCSEIMPDHNTLPRQFWRFPQGVYICPQLLGNWCVHIPELVNYVTESVNKVSHVVRKLQWSRNFRMRQ